MSTDRLIGLLGFIAVVASLVTVILWQYGMAGRYAEIYAREQEQERAAQSEADLRVAEEIWARSQQVGDGR